LHASLIPRLDRIGVAAKEIAQIGSALGREFGYELIEGVRPAPRTGIARALDQLSASGLAFLRGAPPHASYTFKHAWYRNAAMVRCCGRAARTARPRRRGNWGEILPIWPSATGIAGAPPDCGGPERARGQAVAEGRAARCPAARACRGDRPPRAGLSLLLSLPASATRDTTEIELRLALGVSYITVKGMALSGAMPTAVHATWPIGAAM